jgi:hypothetical protein
MPSSVQTILWDAKNATQEFFAYLVKHNLRVVGSRLARAATGATKLMKDPQYLVCGHVLLAIMQQMQLEQKLEMRPALYVKLDISVKVEIATKLFVNLDIIAQQELLEQLNSLALLVPTSHFIEFKVLQAAKPVK